jgi:hypothetical protein
MTPIDLKRSAVIPDPTAPCAGAALAARRVSPFLLNGQNMKAVLRFTANGFA